MRSALHLVAVPFLACLAAACGSSVVEDDGGSGGGTTGATSTVATTAIAATASVGATSTGTSNGGSGPVGSSGTGEGGSGDGGAGQGGFPGTGGSAQTGGGSPGTGGSSSSGPQPFLCGEVECAADEQCCGSQQGTSCIGASDPCQGATLNCQSASNCENGEICCLQGDFQNAESVCTDACEDTQAGPIQLCESAAECPPDVACQEAFGGFKVCTNGFPG